MNEIIKIWDDFKEKTKTEMAKISEEDILNLRSSMYLPFRNTMKSKIFKVEEILKVHKISQPEFKDIMSFTKDYQKILNSIADDMINSEDYFVQNKVHILSKGKYKIEDFVVKNPFKIKKIESLDPENNLEKIEDDTKSNLEKLFFNPIASNMKSEYLEYVLFPNKLSMYSPSSKGTSLYLMGLINFCITHGQDKKIWLEKNKGLKKDYRVRVIIDSTISCFNDYMRPHSIKTVLAVLRMLSLVEIPYFDLIIATSKKPIVLCCGNDTTITLNMKSNLWNIVLQQLTNNIDNCNLLDALQLAYKFKSMNNVKKYYTFVLTDGMLEKDESESLQDYVSFCEECSLEVFGIGLVYYPEGIKNIFNKFVWSINPFMILKALAILIGNTEKNSDNLQLIAFDKKILKMQYQTLLKYLDNIILIKNIKNSMDF